MNPFVAVPILLPLISGALCILAWGRIVVQRVVTLVGVAALLVSSLILLESVRSQGIQVVQMGNWAAPFGITLVADMFSSLMIVSMAVIGFLATL